MESPEQEPQVNDLGILNDNDDEQNGGEHNENAPER
jgi:hypothetical protein